MYVRTGNTLFSPADYEGFFPKKYTGVLYSFGLLGEDEVSRLGVREIGLCLPRANSGAIE